jgi:hypothetical protein
MVAKCPSLCKLLGDAVFRCGPSEVGTSCEVLTEVRRWKYFGGRDDMQIILCVQVGLLLVLRVHGDVKLHSGPARISSCHAQTALTAHLRNDL